MKQKNLTPSAPETPSGAKGDLMSRTLPERPLVADTLGKLEDALKKAKKKKRPGKRVVVCAACMNEGNSVRAARRCYTSGRNEGTTIATMKEN